MALSKLNNTCIFGVLW